MRSACISYLYKFSYVRRVSFGEAIRRALSFDTSRHRTLLFLHWTPLQISDRPFNTRRQCLLDHPGNFGCRPYGKLRVGPTRRGSYCVQSIVFARSLLKSSATTRPTWLVFSILAFSSLHLTPQAVIYVAHPSSSLLINNDMRPPCNGSG